MHRDSSIVLAIAVAIGCSVEQKAGSDTSRAGPATTKSTTDTSTAPGAPGTSPYSTAWNVTPDGIGSIRVGMSVDDIRRVAGETTMPSAAAECSYVRPAAAPPGVSVMLARGEVARIDVD